MLTLLLDSHFPSANLPFLFAAFAVTWAIFFAYAFFVSRRRQEMQREIAELHRELEQKQSAGDDGTGDDGTGDEGTGGESVGG